MMTFKQAVRQARQELLTDPENALEIAMKYAERIDDDFNNASDAIYCEITEMFQD